jgi:hypothetical protein
MNVVVSCFCFAANNVAGGGDGGNGCIQIDLSQVLALVMGGRLLVLTQQLLLLDDYVIVHLYHDAVSIHCHANNKRNRNQAQYASMSMIVMMIDNEDETARNGEERTINIF